jgi:hypothetical protein
MPCSRIPLIGQKSGRPRISHEENQTEGQNKKLAINSIETDFRIYLDYGWNIFQRRLSFKNSDGDIWINSGPQGEIL